jgi:ABC-2 type transport system ATP-binding protein
MCDAIRIHELTKRFGGKIAVDRLTLNVPTGSIFALLGDNGAGKSTTIKVLTGQYPPDSGKAEVLGQDCWSHAIKLRHKVGYVPEKPRFYDWMTVSQIGWFVSGFHEPGFLNRYKDLIHNFHLDPNAKLKNLSKGGYAKVGLSLALAVDPEVLILDEPTSGLDLMIRREFLNSMVAMAGVGRTILICSHQIAEVERIASHVAILVQGKLLISGPLEELKRRFTRIGFRHEGAPPQLGLVGEVMQRTMTGRHVDLLIRDPDQGVLAVLQRSQTVLDYSEKSLNLEEIYAAVVTSRIEPMSASNGSSQPHGAAIAEEG